MALSAQVLIVPLVVGVAHRIWPKDPPKKVSRNKIPVTVAAGPPLPPHGTPEQLNAVLRQAMNAMLYRVQEQNPHQEGEFGVPGRQGEGAPNPDDSQEISLAELHARAMQYGDDRDMQ